MSQTETAARAEPNYIHLSLISKVWHACYVGPHAAGVVELFGTNCIPTPYTKESTLERVREMIARLNPGVEVS